MIPIAIRTRPIERLVASRIQMSSHTPMIWSIRYTFPCLITISFVKMVIYQQLIMLRAMNR